MDPTSSKQFLVSEQISPRIGKTPEGFLVCYDVPIARTGAMVYSKSEAGVMPWLSEMGFDGSGNLRIERDAAEVFREETLASAHGKPVTIDHPADFVNPDNWQVLAKGTTQNVRRGEREQADLLLADLLITDQEAIEFVESGALRQISCGYDAEYSQVASGSGRQKNIIINHIALVRRGRAGARCMIMDAQHEASPAELGRQVRGANRTAIKEVNDQNRNFWTGIRPKDTGAINQRNRQFWSSRTS